MIHNSENVMNLQDVKPGMRVRHLSGSPVMREAIGFLVVVCLLTLLAADANAQAALPGSPVYSSLFLLQNKSVKEELKITGEQATKVKTASEEITRKFPHAALGGKDPLSKEDRERVNRERTNAIAKALSDILSVEQRKRLKQIERQLDPGGSLTMDEDVKKEVKTTAEQKARIAELQVACNKQLAELITAGGPLPEFAEKLRSIRNELTARTLQLLSAEQSRAWNRMVGAPFEIKLEGLFGLKTPPKK